MTRIKQPKISKHLFDTEEEALSVVDSFKHVLSEDGEILTPCYHKTMGLKAEVTKTVYEKETVQILNEETGKNESWEIDTDEVIQESYPTGKWQLDILWFFEEDEEFKVGEDLESSKIDLCHEGNHGLAGYSYLKNKI